MLRSSTDGEIALRTADTAITGSSPVIAERRTRGPTGLLLRLFGKELGEDGCRRLLSAAVAEAEAAVPEYGRIRAVIEAERGSEPARSTGDDPRYWLITVMSGLHHAQAQLDWAREALHLLDEGPGPGQP